MNPKEFARRRRQFMRMIGKDAIAILPAAPVRHRNGDIEYAYRQDSHFYYLSGFPEPEAVAVLIPGRQQAEYLLFVREHDAVREAWEGERAGTEGAVTRYGADDAFPIADIDEILPGLMEQRSRIFYSMGTHPDFDPRILSWARGLREKEFVALAHVLDDMRLYKSRAEQSNLRRAAQIGMGAHRRAMRFARPGRMEYEVTMPTFPTIRSSVGAPTPA
jgi:Xaa-Pro aminopeptidase